MKKTILYLLFLLNTFLLYHCGKENYQLGIEKQDFSTIQTITESLEDWFDLIEIKTVEHPFFYSTFSRVFLGNYQNSVLGEVKYSFYTGLYIDKTRPENYDKAEIDSVKLFLAYQNDTVEGVAKNPIALKLHTLTASIDKDKKYTVNDSIEKKDEISVLEPIFFIPKDSITIDDKKYSALAFKIDPTFIREKIWDLEKDKFNQEELEKNIKGLVFEIENNSGVASFNLTTFPNRMRIFYTLEGKSAHLDLLIYKNNLAFTRIQKTFDATKTAFDGSGLGFQINLQKLKEKYAKTSLNKITLYLPYKSQDEVQKISSSDLGIFIKETEKLSLINSLQGREIVLNEQEKRYEIPFTLHLNELLLGKEKETILWIVPKVLSAKTNGLDFSNAKLEVISTQFEK